MKPTLVTRLRLLASVVSALILIAALLAGWFWMKLRASLPLLDGMQPISGLTSPVKVERDSLGIVTVHATNREDWARAIGWLHAQDRFFQMDLMRRRAAGELSEIFGSKALGIDRSARFNRFRSLAETVVKQFSPQDRSLFEAYTAGVNAGLHALKEKPFEYLLLRVPPKEWKPEDCILVQYAMWLDLQDSTGNYEHTLSVLRDMLGNAGLAFFAPLETSWDAPLDGSTSTPAPTPSARMIDLRTQKATAAVESRHELLEEPNLFGSNCLAISGGTDVQKAGVLANDMHLTLSIPNTWYRASLVLGEAGSETRRITGITLPGNPVMVAGSNGFIAWGFTDSYVDTTDLISLETDPMGKELYHTPGSWEVMKTVKETIAIKDAPAETLEIRTTIWGPVIGESTDHHPLALHWVAHDPAAVVGSTVLMDIMDARDVPQALDLAHHVGMPAQNILVTDRKGALGWTIAGKIPKRIGFNGRLPAVWAYGDRRWDGYLAPEEVPQIIAKPGSPSWTANNRIVGGEELAKLGDGGYDSGPRARQIRDDLQGIVNRHTIVTPRDLLGVQLDDRAVFLARWQELLLKVLSPEALIGHPERAELRRLVENWGARAATDSAGYRFVRVFRLTVAEKVFTPIFVSCTETWPDFHYTALHFEEPLWRLVSEQPIHLLNPGYKTWSELFLASADSSLRAAKESQVAPAQFIWGLRNTARIRHPFAQILPSPLGGFLSMPPDQIPGDSHLPRVIGPDFGASIRFAVSPGHEEEGIAHMPGGQSGHPLSPFFSAGHEAWVRGDPTPFLPGATQHTLTLAP